MDLSSVYRKFSPRFNPSWILSWRLPGPATERVFYFQPAGPSPLYHRDDLVDRPRAMEYEFPVPGCLTITYLGPATSPQSVSESPGAIPSIRTDVRREGERERERDRKRQRK